MKRVVLAAILLMAGTVSAQITNHIWSADQQTGDIFVHEVSGVLNTQITGASTLSQPAAITIAESGQLYATFAGTGQLYRRSFDGSTSSLYPVGAAPAGLAFDVTGNLWVTDSGAASIYQVDQTGNVLSTITPAGAGNFTTAIAVSRFNEIWAGDANGAIYKYDTSGTALATITTTVYTGLRALAVDRNGDCWAAYNSGGVIRYSRSNNTPVATITDSPAPVALAVNNFNELYVANTVGGSVYHYTSQGVTLTSVAAGELLGGISLDGNGDVWAVGVTNGTLFKFSRYGLNQLGSWSVGSNPVMGGDCSGYVQANILHTTSTDDFDNDGDDNLTEVDGGSNPFDAQSTSTNPRPILNGVPRPGATVTLTCRQYNDATFGFAVGGSLGNNSANYIPVPGTSTMIPLENDAFFSFVANNFWHFQNIGGFLDANGEAVGTINIPNAPALVATTWYFAFVTLDNSQNQPVVSVSNNLPVTIRP